MKNEPPYREQLANWFDEKASALDPSKSRELSDEDRTQIANDLLTHALLVDLSSPNKLADDDRIQRVMQALDESRIRSNAKSRSEGESVRIGRRANWSVALLGTAACILAIVGFLAYQKSDDNQIAEAPSNAKLFAEVAQAVDVEWIDNPLTSGTRLGAQTLAFRSGLVRLLFDSGVEVTLEGPAEYALLDSSQTRLLSGVLAATVPKGAEGFTVNTPTVEVVDLGTSFGIDLRKPGISNVAVFDGEVEVAALDSSEKHLLTEGQAVSIGTNLEFEVADLEIDRFEKLWPIASGILGSSDAFQFVPPWPKQVRFVDSDDTIFVAAEGHPVTLREDLKVNISKAGTYDRAEKLTPVSLRTGRQIRSYILHYMPESKLRGRRAKRMKASITFDRDVVGLIVQHEELLASSRRFSRRSAGEANVRRQLELSELPDGDRIALSENRRTVSVDLVSPGRSSDLVRVIVEAPFKRNRRRGNRRPGLQGRPKPISQLGGGSRRQPMGSEARTRDRELRP